MKSIFSLISKKYGLMLYFILLFLVMSLIFFFIFGCKAEIPENTSSAEKGQASDGTRPIRIAINIWPGTAYAFIAVDKGFFKNNGVDVELILSKEYSESLNFYENGDVDGFIGVFPDVILYNAQGNKTTVVFVADYSDTSDVIIANSIFDSLGALKGKKIGIESINSFSHLFVLEVFNNIGVDESELQFEIVPSQEISEALDTGVISAGHSWDPEKTKALNKGYKIVATAGDVPGLITDVLALRDSLTKENPGDVGAIVKSLLQARDFLDTNPEEALQIMIKYEGGTAEEMAAAIKEMHLLDLQDNLLAMEPSNKSVSLYGAGAIISDYYRNRGQISTILNFDEIIDSSFVNIIANN